MTTKERMTAMQDRENELEALPAHELKAIARAHKILLSNYERRNVITKAILGTEFPVGKEPVSPPTKVIFRHWPLKEGGGVIALFPEIFSNVTSTGGCLCQSYERVGQHGGADYNHVMGKTTPANHNEYAKLKHELEQIGYVLDVRSRAGHREHQTRRNEMLRINKAAKLVS